MTRSFGGEKERGRARIGKSGRGRKRKEPPMPDDQTLRKSCEREEIKEEKYIEEEAPRRASFNGQCPASGCGTDESGTHAEESMKFRSCLSSRACVSACHLILIHHVLDNTRSSALALTLDKASTNSKSRQSRLIAINRGYVGN